MFDHVGTLTATWRPGAGSDRSHVGDVFRCRHCQALVDGSGLDGHRHQPAALTFVLAGADDHGEQARAAEQLQAVLAEVADGQVVAADVTVTVRPLP